MSPKPASTCPPTTFKHSSSKLQCNAHRRLGRAFYKRIPAPANTAPDRPALPLAEKYAAGRKTATKDI
jgi:hypothetical protein